MDNRSFLLYRERRIVKAADASVLEEQRHVRNTEFLDEIFFRNKKYSRLKSEDAVMFWDEFRNNADQTVGYSFILPRSPSFRSSFLVTGAENSRLVGADRDILDLLLQDCEDPRRECIQGFGSEVYQSPEDPRDCILLMLDWSEDAIGFGLTKGLVHPV